MTSTIDTKIYPIPVGSARLQIPISTVIGSHNNKILEYLNLKDILNSMIDKENLVLQKLTNNLLAARLDRAQYDKIKNGHCPGFLVGRFSPSRKDDHCQVYVPLLGFDIDALEDEFNMECILADCRSCPYIYLAYPSPSRKGIRIFVWCDSDLEKHKIVYEAVCQMLSEALRLKTDKTVRKELKTQGITETKKINALLKQTEHIDTGTKNISRHWFYTHLVKQDIYLNENSEVFKIPLKTIEKRPKRPPLLTTTTSPLDPTEKLRLCAKMAKQRNILPGRNNGLYSLSCLMVEHGVNEKEILNYCLSLQEVDFTESEIIKTVNSAVKRADPNKFNDAQLLKWRLMTEGPAGDHKLNSPNLEKKEEKELEVKQKPLKHFDRIDWEDSEVLENLFGNKNLSTYLKVKAYLLSKYEFRKNVISNDVEYRLRDSTESFGDVNEHDLVCEILDFGIKAGVDAPLMSLLRSNDYVPRFNPIKFYFKHLPEWNQNQPDHINDLANYVVAKDQEWFNYQFKKMMVRTAACVLNFVPFNKQCFTLLGVQNDGKTSFLRFLCPEDLKDYYKENIDITNKDGKIALCQNMFINFEELDALNKKELNKIKAMFTVDKVKVRPPYERRERNFPRTCNFLASSNRHEILTDETGNIRWLVFEILSINHDNGGKKGYNQNIDIDRVWAQAFYLLKSGFKFNLTREDLDKSEKNNKSYQQITVEMEWIQKLFTSSNNLESNSQFLMASDILKAVQEHSQHNRINITNVGKALRFLNFNRSQNRIGKGKNPRYGYWVKFNSLENE